MDFPFEYVQIPIPAKSVNKILKIRCCVQDNLEITPPQLQGKSGIKINIYPIYALKINIKIKEACNPKRLVLGKNNKTAIKYSQITADHAMNFAKDNAVINLLKV